jgi:hypothetical protein
MAFGRMGAQGRGFGRIGSGVGAGEPVALIILSASTIAEDAGVGDAVGTLSVSNGSGSYTFTLTDDAGGLFAIDGDDLEVDGALDYETATSHSITVEADNGVDDPISRQFTITVTDVEAEGPGAVVLSWDGDDTDTRPDFDVDLPSGQGAPLDAEVDDVLVIQYRLQSGVDGDYAEYLTDTLDAGEVAGDTITVPGVDPLSDGDYYFRARLVAEGGVAPVLTSPIDTVTGSTTADLGVTTDQDNGTLYWVVTTSSTGPTAAQVKLGQDHTGSAAAASGSQAVSATGAQVANDTGLTANTAYFAHFMHENAATDQSNVATGDGFTTYHTEAQALFAQISSQPDATRKGVINTLIGSMKSASIWTKFDFLYVLAAHDSQTAGLNWINPGTSTLTPTNSPTFTADRGYQGNGSNAYLATGIGQNATVQATQNSRSWVLGVETLGTAGASNWYFGGDGAGTFDSLNYSAVGAQTYRISTGSSASVATGAVGRHIGIRVDANNLKLWRDGAQVDAEAIASSAAPAINYTILRTSTLYSNGRVWVFGVSSKLADADATALDNALAAYQTAMGF